MAMETSIGWNHSWNISIRRSLFSTRWGAFLEALLTLFSEHSTTDSQKALVPEELLVLRQQIDPSGAGGLTGLSENRVMIIP